MRNPEKPEGSVACERCGSKKEESGGYRERKLRTLKGIEEIRLKRIRCAGCKRQLRVEYTQECQRYRWYSRQVQGLFTILDS